MAATRRIFSFLLVLLSLVGAPCLLYAQEEGTIVRAIKIQGNQRIDSSTIKYYINSKVGEPVSKSQIREDIEEIFNLGQFKDIRVDSQKVPGGVELIFIVEEIPSIGAVKFEGNENIETKDLREDLGLVRGATFKPHLVREAIEHITTIYHDKGYFFVDIKVETKETRQGMIDIVFRIKEDEKVKIEEINFTGNEAFDEGDLEDEMEIDERGFFSWLTESGIYKKDVLKLDMLRLEAFYQDHGYLHARILEPRIEVDEKEREIFIFIGVEEGEQYTVGEIKISGDDAYTDKEILEAMKTESGEIYNISQLREDLLAVTEMYSKKGYAYAEVRPGTRVDEKEKKVDVQVIIDRGKKVYVGEIHVRGNTITRENVVRREFRLKEGELFDSEKLKRTKQRLVNTQFFKDVKIDTKRGKEPDLIDLETTITEQPTGTLSLGAGFSSVENFVFTGGISQDNLFGRGQKLAFNASLSSIRTDFGISFTDPRIMDSEIPGGIDLFNRNRNFFSFESETRGAGVRLGKSIGEFNWFGLNYRFERVAISDVAVENENEFLRNETRITSRIGPTFIRDTRDNFFNPTEGWRHVVRFEVAGSVLGGAEFHKSSYEVSYYQPLIGPFVGLVHGQVKFARGYDGEVLPAFERYFMGGPNSLRGYNITNVGPRSAVGDPVGGRESLLLNVELIYPATKNFRFFGFYDRGNVYGNGKDPLGITTENIDVTVMREGVGGGVRVFTPFGPITLAYGVKIDPKPGEDSGEFHFSAGSSF